MHVSPVVFFRSFRAFRILLAVLGLCLWAPGHAQTILNVPADQPTIQAAINAAADNYEIIVAPGTYYENLVFGNKYITLTSSGGAAVTILDGSRGAAPAILLNVGTQTHQVPYPTVVNGFTIRGGGVEPSTALTGGILAQVDATISNNIITANHCAGIASQAPHMIITGNEIDGTLDNGGDCPAGGGSALLIRSLDDGCAGCAGFLITIRNNVLRNNLQGGHEGTGGAAITDLAYPAVIQGNTITGNVSAALGSAIYLGAYNNTEIVGNLIRGNTAACGGAGFTDARTNPIQAAGDLLFANNTVADNLIAGTCTGSATTTAAQIVFNDGSQAFTSLFVNNIVRQASGSAPAIACKLSSAAAVTQPNLPIFDHNLFFNPAAPVFDSTCTDPTGTFGNLTADPQFAPGTYAPILASPAIDAGDTSILRFEQLQNLAAIDTALDLAGNPRVADATAKTYSIIDIGAYELPAAPDPQATLLTLNPTGTPTAQSAVYTANAAASVNLVASALCPAGGSLGPQGPITFLEDGIAIGTIPLVAYSAQATLQNVFLAPGTHLFTVTYAGQGACNPGVSVPIEYLVSNYNAALTLTSSVNPSLPGQSVIFSVTFTSNDPSQTGPVTLTDNGNPFTPFTLVNGKASYTTGTLTTGTHTILASYAGDATHNATSAGVQQVVAPAGSTTLNAFSDLDPSALGQAVDFYINVTPVFGSIAKGSVTLSDGNAPLVTLPLDATGAAVYTTSTLSVGSHTINIVYTPAASSGFLTSATSVAQQVLPVYTTSLRLVSSKNPSAYGQSVNFIATVSSNTAQPTGSVQFYDGSALLGSVVLNGNSVASFPIATLAPGTHAINAGYTPDPYLGPSSGSITQTVTPVAGTLLVTPEPSFFAQPFTITVFTPGTGNVSFSIDGTLIGTTPVTANQASIQGPATLSAGTHTIVASYTALLSAPAVQYTGTHVVKMGVPTGSIAVSPEPTYPGQPYTVILTLNGPPGLPAPTGTAKLVLDGTIMLSAQGTTSGSTYTAVFTGLTSPLVGSHTIQTTYVGDSNYSSVVFTTTHAVVASPTTSTLTPTTPLTVFYGQPLDGVASVQVLNSAFPATGVYTIQDNGVDVPLCTGLSLGTVCPYGNPILLRAGPHALAVKYLGDPDNAPSISTPILYTVKPDTTAATLTSATNPSALGQAVVLSVTVTGNILNPIAGPVQFFDGATPIALLQLDARGKASFSVSTLTTGTHSLTVVYLGSAEFLPITSAPLLQVVTPVATPPGPTSFSLTVSPTPVTVGVGRTANFIVSVTPGYVQPVALTCSGLATETACTFFLPTIPAGGGATGLQLSTMAPHDCGDPGHPYFLGQATPPTHRVGYSLLYGSPAALAALALFGIRRRRRLTRLTALALLTALGITLSALSGCGHCTDLGTRPGTYTFTVTGTAQGGPSTQTASQQVQIAVTIP